MSEAKMGLAETVEEYCTQLRRRQVEGSLPCAKRTSEVLRYLVTNQRHTNAAALIEDVRKWGFKMQAAKPIELAIGNIVRRVLHIIREEQQAEGLEEVHEAQPHRTEEQSTLQGPGLLSQALRGPGNFNRFGRALSLSNLLDVGIDEINGYTYLGDTGGTGSGVDQDSDAHSMAGSAVAGGKKSSRKVAPQWGAKHNVIDAVNELLDELDMLQFNIAQQAVEHIHANEVILTFGMSDTTFLFLKEASKKREFQVVVAEGAPRFDGHLLARKLADAGVQTTLIADSAVFAMMARSNKVLVGGHAVLANGGVIAPVGIHMVALAAKKHSIPFVVLVGLHKLSPLFPHDADVTYNEFLSPANVIDFDILGEAFDVRTLQGEGEPSGVHVPSPKFDYVPPSLISLFVTDTGGYTPSYVYRLLAEYYSREDYLLTKEAADLM